jgi:RimJ/RimL family protein N-acetyltransferase
MKEENNEEIELKFRSSQANYPGYSARLKFRPLKITDTQLLSPIFKKEAKSIRTFLGSYQNADKWDFSDSQKFVSHMVNTEKFPSMHYLFLIGKEVVGIGSLEPYRSNPKDVQVVLAVFGHHQGKGIGQSIAATLKAVAFEVWGFERLLWLNDVTNHASSKVAQSLGLALEASYEDNFLYGEKGTGLWYRWSMHRPIDLPPGVLQGANLEYWSSHKSESMLRAVLDSKNKLSDKQSGQL